MFILARWLAPTAGAALCGVFVPGLVLAAEIEERPAVIRREMSTDRPDSTESPFTLGPGRTQVEMSFASRERDRQDGTRTTTWEAAPFNVRAGVTRNTEAGFFFLPYQRVTEEGPDGRVVHEGVGDLTLRGKWNLRGNDGNDGNGAGVILDVTLPTAPREFGRRKVEVAATVPVAFELGGGWSGGAMASLQAARDERGARRPLFFNTLTAGHDLVGGLGGFLEFASYSGHGRHVLTFNCGLTHAVNDDLQLDLGTNIGVTRTAPDLLWFAGVSRRF